jgi:2,4-dienoyl-CoA reductase (NADPH2)
VIDGHLINDPVTVRKLISDGFFDLVSMGRDLTADPDLPHKALDQHEERIVHCVACAQGCFDHLFVGEHVECHCNPKAVHEYELSEEKSSCSLKVAVVSGDAASIAAATAAAEKGHAVTLFEKSLHLVVSYIWPEPLREAMNLLFQPKI